MPESAAESALWMTQAKRNFELGLPFTLVSGLFSGPRLRRAVVSYKADRVHDNTATRSELRGPWKRKW